MKIRFTVRRRGVRRRLYGNPVAEEFWGTLPDRSAVRDFNKIEKVGTPLHSPCAASAAATRPDLARSATTHPRQGLALYYGHVGKSAWPPFDSAGSTWTSMSSRRCPTEVAP